MAERELFDALPALRHYIIAVPGCGTGRLRALRHAARHLDAGKTLITYPAGRTEPDPAHRPAGDFGLVRAPRARAARAGGAGQRRDRAAAIGRKVVKNS